MPSGPRNGQEPSGAGFTDDRPAARQAAAATIAIVETGGTLTAIDLITRAARFTLPTGDGNRSVPVASGGLVCVGTAFGQLYGIVAP